MVLPLGTGDLVLTFGMGVMGRSPALPNVKNETRSGKLWIAGYATFTTAICLLAGIRLWWSWPDAAWLSNFWFLDDINRLLNGDLGKVTWFAVGDQWAMNGYRWFEYINAAFFGYNAQLENVCYYLIVLVMSLLVGLRILNRLPREHAVWPRVTVFLIPAVLASMSGAGSRGMELGTFTGVLIVVAIFLLLDSSVGNRTYLVITMTAVPFVIFVFLGGYASGPTFALVVFWSLQYWRPTLIPQLRRRLTILTATYVFWTAFYFVLIRLLSPSTGKSEVAEFFGTLSRDPMLPIKYLFWGPAASLFTSQTIESASGTEVGLAAGVSVLVILLTALAVIVVYRRGWTEATVPLLLILYPCGIALTLLATRSSDVMGLLNTWYSLHFKVALVGVIWLAILGLREGAVRFLPTRIVVTALLAGLAIALVMANVVQFNRQPFERTYFLNIASQTLIPSELTEDAAGLTALQLPLKESIAGVTILRNHKIGVYHDPTSTWDQIYGHQPKFVSYGSIYADGWTGTKFSVAVLDPSCRTLNVQLANPLLTTQDITFAAKPSFSSGVKGTLSAAPTHLRFTPRGGTPIVEFYFSSSVTPSKLGVSADTRKLSALVKLNCRS